MFKALRYGVLSLSLAAVTAGFAMADRVIIIEKPAVEKIIIKEVPAKQRPLIQLALLLDTSNSMDGLINQARGQLWTIVNELAATKRDGQVPELQVALYQYGNSGLPASEGYIRQMVPFTTDLDVLSRELFALRTNGGSEYCGHAIKTAMTELDWSKRDDVYKVIFIAGNEPFTQGNVAYQEAISKARAHDVVVNTIHCGTSNAGINGQWQQGATLGGGDFFNIDQDQKVVYIKSPYDDKIQKLNVELNNTYIWYGARGKEAKENQVAQDTANAKLSPSAALERTATKAKAGVYTQSEADLVDASGREGFDMEAVKDEALPTEMREMSVKEREAFVAENARRRGQVQAEIAELAKKRDAYVAAERKRQAGAAGEATLGDAVKEAAVAQAAERGFKKSEE